MMHVKVLNGKRNMPEKGCWVDICLGWDQGDSCPNIDICFVIDGCTQADIDLPFPETEEK